MLKRAVLTRATTFLLLVLVFVLPNCCFAQAPLEPTQLPAQTSFYLIWRGTPQGDIRQTNALLSFWDDPDCAPLRSAIVDALMSDSNKQKDKPALTRDELTQYSSLLDNAFVLGYISRPDDLPTAKTPATGAPAWQGLFFVYDRTGKEALLSKAVLRMRGADTDIPKISEVTMAGVPALKIERKSSVNYWAETGKFAVSAQDKSVFEIILNRLNGKGSGSSVADSAAYREAKPLLAGGILELFFRVPDLKKLVSVDSSSTAQAKQAATLVQALKLESIHSVAGHVTLEGAKTRLQGAVLGEPTPGSLFDIWSDGQAAPLSMSLLSSDTVFYHESQIDFLGIYTLLKNALMQSGPNSSQFVAPLETAAQTRLGMPIPDALGLTTGEIASLENSPTLDDTQQVRVLGIRNKPDALKLLRTLMGDQITSERNEGQHHVRQDFAAWRAEFGRRRSVEFLPSRDDAKPVARRIEKRAASHVAGVVCRECGSRAAKEFSGGQKPLPRESERLFLFRRSKSGLARNESALAGGSEESRCQCQDSGCRGIAKEAFRRAGHNESAGLSAPLAHHDRRVVER